MTKKELRDALKELGMPHWFFAEMFGVSESAVSRWLRDEGPAARSIPGWVPPVINLLREKQQWRKTQYAEGRGDG